jgi:hypothetical protein
MARDESLVLVIEDKVNELIELIDQYGREMQHALASRGEHDPVAKLAKFQVTRVGWLNDLSGQMEEIVRDMLDRVQQVELAEKGTFTGKPDDVIQKPADPSIHPRSS